MAGFSLFDPNYDPNQNSAFYGQNNWMNTPTQSLSFGSPQAATFNTQPLTNNGFNWNRLGAGINFGVQGLSALGNLWGAFQSNRMAQRQFDFTKDITNTNLNNQIKTYNTSLEDRARSRAAVEGQSPQETQDWIERNRLTRSGS